jgi:hypothetical protein
VSFGPASQNHKGDQGFRLQWRRPAALFGFNDKRVIEDYENLGEEHQIMKPELVTATTAFGEYTRPASQVEMSKTPQSWDDPILCMQGASQPVWMTDANGKPL